MTTQLVVNVHEAKTHFSKLLERAHTGQEIILAKAGKPYARLMPLPPVVRQRLPGRLAHAGPIEPAFFEALPDAELCAWESR
jgi:prevent-host-death family protein